MKDIFKGKLVRLAAFDPEEIGKAYAGWNRDSEFHRLLDSDAAVLYSAQAGINFLKKCSKRNRPSVTSSAYAH
jgi:hypothetical protein